MDSFTEFAGILLTRGDVEFAMVGGGDRSSARMLAELATDFDLGEE